MHKKGGFGPPFFALLEGDAGTESAMTPPCNFFIRRSYKS